MKKYECDCCGKAINDKERYTLTIHNDETMWNVNDLCMDCINKVLRAINAEEI